jgi:hypothetical protein
MGAWGHRSFDNDSALDWLGELSGIAKLRRAFTTVTQAEPKQYIDVDDASAAIAAAELIAAARGHTMKGLPDTAADWLADHANKVTTRDAQLARAAIVRVQKSSELQELWAENGVKNPWQREIAKLLERLTKKPVVARAARTTVNAKAKPAAKKPRRQRAAPIEIEYRYVKSPDGTLTASNSEYSGMCTVMIEASGGGGSVFAAMCGLDAIGMRWINGATLEVTYPATAKLVGKRDDSWFFMGTTVAVRYRTT